MKHTLVVSVLDQPGVLSRVVGLLRRRAFNIDSLTVAATEQPERACITLVVDTARSPAHLVAANLRKLVPVTDVHDVTHLATVERDLALVRVTCPPAERAELASLVEIFRARIADVADDSVVVEVTGDATKVDGLVELLRTRGIVEMVRTGRVAMLRGRASSVPRVPATGASARV